MRLCEARQGQTTSAMPTERPHASAALLMLQISGPLHGPRRIAPEYFWRVFGVRGNARTNPVVDRAGPGSVTRVHGCQLPGIGGSVHDGM